MVCPLNSPDKNTEVGSHSPRDLPNPGIEPRSAYIAGRFFKNISAILLVIFKNCHSLFILSLFYLYFYITTLENSWPNCHQIWSLEWADFKIQVKWHTQTSQWSPKGLWRWADTILTLENEQRGLWLDEKYYLLKISTSETLLCWLRSI